MQQPASSVKMPGGSIENLPTGDSIAHDHSPAPEGALTTPSENKSKSKFDPSLYRRAASLGQEDSANWGRKLQTVIPVRKPTKKQFVRTHSSPDYRIDDMPTITDEASGEIYLLAPDLQLPDDIVHKIDLLSLVTSITADGSLFLWCYKNTTNSWHESTRIAVREASGRWVRVSSDKSSNGYLLEFPVADPPEPIWPKITFADILEKAFGSRLIESLSHPQVKKLRGDFHA